MIQSFGGRLGAGFHKACYCFDLQFEGGYELLSELRIINRITKLGISSDNTVPNGGFSFNEWSDFTLNGPYLRINLTY